MEIETIFDVSSSFRSLSVIVWLCIKGRLRTLLSVPELRHVCMLKWRSMGARHYCTNGLVGLCIAILRTVLVGLLPSMYTTPTTTPSTISSLFIPAVTYECLVVVVVILLPELVTVDM